ncbi:anti sigma factor C-terminal domain-containing protein [Neobacillus sp. PS2-9]|uniref:anti sigma factor C-terminal domain-containing protein n=1 Tax=Neobacillus sp. PS2-9 TaxID=3070676 RepID=UPI0027E1AEDF|nr:anti sigma factor C-terminal domain-containing protein [Neobacillus sp. PS2-9]WML58715.1 anti sigma factor C-terminal domain-containing protein [Neobacillus sp. PS2-9]
MKDKNYHEDFDDNNFEFDHVFNDKMKNTVKKAKIKSFFRTILISIVTVLLLGLAVSYVSGKRVEKNSQQLTTEIMNRHMALGANTFTGTFWTKNNTFSGEAEYTTFKYVNGIRVFTGTHGYTYNVMGYTGRRYSSIAGGGIDFTRMNKEELFLRPKFNDLEQRLMEFYYPFVDYKTFYKNDLSKVAEIGDNKYIEMGISFDKLYTMDEINKLLPRGMNLTWYWVDVLNKQEKENVDFKILKQQGKNGMVENREEFPSICYEDRAYGFHAINEYGEKLEDPEEYFKSALQKADMKDIYQQLAGKDGIIDNKDIKIQGVVVTGDARSLIKLKGLPFIKASSLGIVTDKY